METFDEREARAKQKAADQEKEFSLRKDRAVEEATIREDLEANDGRGFSTTREISRAVDRGFYGAAEEIFDGVASLDEWAMSHMGSLDLNPFDGDGIWWQSPEDAIEQKDKSFLRFMEDDARRQKEAITAPETAGGAVLEIGTRFIAGWIATAPVKGVQVAGKAGLWGIAAVRGAITDFGVFDGHEERASDFLIEFDSPILNNVVTQYLAVGENEDVSELEGRMKSVLEGGGLGMMVEGLMQSFRLLRGAKIWKASKTKAEKAEAIQDAIDTKLDKAGEGVDESARAVDVEETIAGKFNNDEAVKTSTQSASGDFHVIENADGALRVTAKDDTVRGGLDLADRGDFLQVTSNALPKSGRGKGNGTKMLIEALDYAFSVGKKFASDSQLSVAATRTWQALKRRGYKVIKEEHIIDAEGNWVSKNGRPLYRVDEPLEAVGATARVDEEITRLGRNSSPEEVADEIARAMDEGRLPRIDFESLAEDPKALFKFQQALEIAIKTARRVPQEETIAAAQRLHAVHGDSLAPDLLGDVLSDAGLAARIVASDTIDIASRKRLIALAERYTKTEAKEDGAAFMQQLNNHKAVDATARGNRAETARATRAMAVTKAQRVATDFDLEELIHQLGQETDLRVIAKQLLDSQNDPKAISELMQRSWKKKAWDVLMETFYGNILGSTSTQLANIYGNTFKLAEHIIQRTIAVSVGTVRGGVMKFAGKEFSRQQVDEFMGLWVGLWKGVEDAFRLNIKAILGNADEAGFSLRKASKDDRIQFWSDQKEQGTVWRALFTAEPQTDIITKLEGMPGRQRAVEWHLPANLKDRSMVEQMAHRGLAAIVNPVGGLVRLPGKALVVFDELFKTLSRDMQRTTLAYGDASALARVDSSRTVHEIAAELLKDSSRYSEEALEFARRQTFQQKLGSKGQAVEGFVRQMPVARVVVPFVRTPTNLVKDAYNQVAIWRILSKDVRGKLLKGGKEADMAIARLTMSAGILGFIYKKWSAGEIRGGASRPNSARMDDVKNYSLKFNDKWYTFNRLDPLGMPIGFAADIFEMLDQVADEPEQSLKLEAALAGVFVALSQNLISKTWLRGVSDLVAALGDAEKGRPKSFADYTGSILGSMVPLAGSNFERRRAAGEDEFSRYVFTWADSFRMRIPSAESVGAKVFPILPGTGVEPGEYRQSLGVRRDPLGRPIKEAASLTSVIQVSEETPNYLDQVLSRLDFTITTPSRNISGIDLDTNQYSKLLFLRGQIVRRSGMTLEERLERELHTVTWDLRTIVGQQERVNDIMRDYTRKAREQLLREDPELARQVKEADDEKKLASRLVFDKQKTSSDPFALK